jgi:hypothetical protein
MEGSVIRFPWLIVLVSMFATSGASAAKIDCPANIDLAPVNARDVPDGWSTLQRFSRLAVDGAFISVGPPSNRMDLKPESETLGGQKVSIWKFDGAENQHGLWLSCSYGKWLVLLSKKLPPGTTQCRGLAPTVDAKGSLVMQVDCQ